MANKQTKRSSKYDAIITDIFSRHYQIGMTELQVTRDEFTTTAVKLGETPPKNLGDLVYTYRYRKPLPETIRSTQPAGYEWMIFSTGISVYKFALVPEFKIAPAENYLKTKIPDATPGIIRTYAMNDEQALLAILRYNRLVDIFTGLTCYSLQNHLRTTVKGIGQVETDELYVGIDKHGMHYIIPIQAKGGRDKIGPVQISQDFAVCAQKFPELICRPLAAQFMQDGSIALFEFITAEDGIRIAAEKHYKLVQPHELTDSELAVYRNLAT
jgi:hypothetical protein